MPKPQQRTLSFSPRFGDCDHPYEEQEDPMPFENARFPDECRPIVVALARRDWALAEDGKLNSSVPCPYRVGHTLYHSLHPDQQLFDRQQRLFEDALPVPLMLTCDCPDPRELLEKLGKGLPWCSKNRCPVRIMVQEHD